MTIEAMRLALEALEVADSWGTWHRGSEAITALRAALAENAMQRLTDTQDWNEIKALRESLREHMAEIHRLRAALAEGAMHRLTDVQQEMENDSFDKQPASGIHLGVSDGADRDVEAMTDVQQEMVATSQEFRQVEPVAYVTGYSKGYATVRPVDPCLLMCVGMALYRSPPKSAHDKVYSEVDLADAYQKGWDDAMLRRAIERAHGIGGEG